MATKKLQDLTASTSPGDADIMLIEDTTATKKITFLNLFNRIKTKLGLATVATSGKLADTVKDEDNRTITDAERAKWNGYGNDLASLNSNLNAANFDLTVSTYYPATNIIVSGRTVQLHCSGLIVKDVPANAELAVGTLPEAYRPPYKVIKYVLGAGTADRLFRVSIDVDGKVTYAATTAAATGVGVNINETFVARSK